MFLFNFLGGYLFGGGSVADSKIIIYWVYTESCLPTEDSKSFMELLTVNDRGRISPGAADGVTLTTSLV